MSNAPLLSPTQGAIDCGCHSGAQGMGAGDFWSGFTSSLGDAFSKEAGAAAAKSLVGAGTDALLSQILPKKKTSSSSSTGLQQLPQQPVIVQQPQYQPPPPPPPMPQRPAPKNYTLPIAIGAGALTLVGLVIYAAKKKK